MKKKYVDLSMRASYSPRDDSIHLTSDDARLSKRGWRLTLNRGTNAETGLRRMLQAEGVIQPKVSLPGMIAYPWEDKRPWDQFPLGLNTQGEEEFLDLSYSPHTLLAGRTGSGKSVVQRSIIAHALQSRIPWRIIGIDLKRVELIEYPRVPFVGNRFEHITDLEQAAVAIEAAEAEMMNRYAQLEAAGKYHMKPLIESGHAYPIMILIDEMYHLLAPEDHQAPGFEYRNQLRADTMAQLGSILRLGRAAAVHVVMASQRPDLAGVLPGELRSNMENRILMGPSDPKTSAIMLDNQLGTEVPRIRGRGIAFVRDEYNEVQFYYMAPGGVSERMSL